MSTEYRFLTHDIEARAEKGENGELIFRGYAAKFNKKSRELWDPMHDRFIETIKPGAFRNALKNSETRFTIDHSRDVNSTLGSTRNGSLRLWEDDIGLAFEATAPDTQAARDSHELVRSGIVSSMSFAFVVNKNGDKWEDGDGNMPAKREITDIRDLPDVSIVTEPAYPQAGVKVREYLMESGVNVDALESVVEARSAGRDISEDGQEAARAAIEALDKCIKDVPAPIQEDEAEPEKDSATAKATARSRLAKILQLKI